MEYVLPSPPLSAHLVWRILAGVSIMIFHTLFYSHDQTQRVSPSSAHGGTRWWCRYP